jgi:predicted nucleic acid-binding protein
VIVLDTNVLSELVRPVPDAVVARWFAAQDLKTVFTTAISRAEILYGLEIAPIGKRRTQLDAALTKLFEQVFPGRVLPFDEHSAQMYAKIFAGREAIGHPISDFDCMIAAICRSRGAELATRNIKDFEHCGIRVFDPWLG